MRVPPSLAYSAITPSSRRLTSSINAGGQDHSRPTITPIFCISPPHRPGSNSHSASLLLTRFSVVASACMPQRRSWPDEAISHLASLLIIRFSSHCRGRTLPDDAISAFRHCVRIHPVIASCMHAAAAFAEAISHSASLLLIRFSVIARRAHLARRSNLSFCITPPYPLFRHCDGRPSLRPTKQSLILHHSSISAFSVIATACMPQRALFARRSNLRAPIAGHHPAPPMYCRIIWCHHGQSCAQPSQMRRAFQIPLPHSISENQRLFPRLESSRADGEDDIPAGAAPRSRSSSYSLGMYRHGQL